MIGRRMAYGERVRTWPLQGASFPALITWQCEDLALC